MADYQSFYGLDASRRDGVSYRIGSVDSGPFKLAVQRWSQAGASHNLLLVHGYFDHVGLFGKLVDYGLSRHCNVLAFDLPGHGLSSGAVAEIDSFDQYSDSIAAVLAAADWPALPCWVMAQSTGAAALINYARHYPWPFRDTVLLAPLIRPQGWRQVQVMYRLSRAFVSSVPRRFSRNSSDQDFLDFIQQDPLQSRRIPLCWIGALGQWLAELEYSDLRVGPALVVQGDADGTVDWRYNMQRISSLFPSCRIELIPGAGHHLANEAQPLRERYYRAVDRYMGFNSRP
ncbi:alpha/beta hydrolase [Parahaliea sp. F7430]|uniref:Alpha/beta hydrolase n=1 Tax=Sediminihaliea albiluteola TaxID=2758564 RepID=A0A7W2TX27_9GAMM|nr:alpha/beta hydrolase [Sediminihaliea albiluteola]MBA6413543.1 alpha/beta hydrolase [Sediminihaliea albiluteola]